MIKKILTVLTVILLLQLPIKAYAADVTASGTCGENITWVLYDDGKLEITGTGDMWNYSFHYGTAPWAEYSKSITAVNIGFGITSIGNNAFVNCSNLYHIELPDGITSIGNYAFDNSGLKDIKLPSSLISIGHSAFLGTNLSSIIFPEKTTSIDDWAFYGCYELEYIVMPKGITSIGTYAFDECPSLQTVYGYSGTCAAGVGRENNCTFVALIAYGFCDDDFMWWHITEDGELVIEGTGDMPVYSSAEEIPWKAYADHITSVRIGAEVSYIDIPSFAGCNNIAEVSVAESNVAYSADRYGVLFNKEQTTLLYYPAAGDEIYVVPDSVTSIHKNAFAACNECSEVWIPESVTVIGDNAFNCSGLITIFGRGGTAAESYAVANGIEFVSQSWKLDEEGTLTIEGTGKMFADSMILWGGKDNVLSIKICEGVTSIAPGAFFDFRNLTTVELPSTLTCIDYSAFMWCGNLTSVTIQEGVTSIGAQAFYNCTSLASITIPKSVTMIGDAAIDPVNIKTIYGYSGTAAETYALKYKALKYNITFVDLTPAKLEGVVLDEATGKYCYMVNGEIDTTMTGLGYLESENKYLYFENGVQNLEHYGLVEFGGGQFLVANGTIATEISGLQLIGDNFYFLAYGQLQNQYSGLAMYDNAWFYVVDGVLQLDFNGLLDFDGSKFLIATGQIMNQYTGLYNDPVTGNWYYIVYGQVQTDYTGLVFYDNAWFYLVNGVLASDYIGYVEFDGSQFYVQYGQVVA